MLALSNELRPSYVSQALFCVEAHMFQMPFTNNSDAQRKIVQALLGQTQRGPIPQAARGAGFANYGRSQKQDMNVLGRAGMTGHTPMDRQTNPGKYLGTLIGR